MWCVGYSSCYIKEKNRGQSENFQQIVNRVKSVALLFSGILPSIFSREVPNKTVYNL